MNSQIIKAHLLRWRASVNATLALTPELERFFADFTAVDGDRAAMMTTIASATAQVERRFHRWRNERDAAAAKGLSEAFADGIATVATDRVWHRALKYRSYTDASLATKVLRAWTDYLVRDGAFTPIEVVTAILTGHPDHRAALLALGQLQLEAGQLDEAIEAAQRALRVQAVCLTAEDILFSAYRQKQARGEAVPESLPVDYDLSDRFCAMPFTHLSTGVNGETFLCSCPSWVPFSVGNALTADSAEALWNSDVAAEIRRSILDGDYGYCSRTQCSYLNARKLPARADIKEPRLRRAIDEHLTRIDLVPDMVELNHDPTCNLACPSCRTQIVGADGDDVDTFGRATERVFLPLLRKVNGYAYITGGGEAFSSRHFRAILKALNRDEFPGLKIYLLTNGQLMTPSRWRDFPRLGEMVGILSVSIDAATADTYEQLRRPGKWAPLMKNLEFLSELRQSGTVPSMSFNFVVQRDNFREIPAFLELGRRFHTDMFWLQRLVNYGAYDQQTFTAINVADPAHPDHEELLSILRMPELNAPNVEMNMLRSLLPEYVASDATMGRQY